MRKRNWCVGVVLYLMGCVPVQKTYNVRGSDLCVCFHEKVFLKTIKKTLFYISWFFGFCFLSWLVADNMVLLKALFREGKGAPMWLLFFNFFFWFNYAFWETRSLL